MNKNLKNKILALKAKGFSYNEIAKELNCSKGTVSYHLGTGQKAKSKSRAILNREKKKSKDKAHRKYLQEFSWRYKKLCGCIDCGEKNPVVLQYDHINRELKITTVSQMISDRWSLKNIKEEIRKCEIRCANCHLIKTAIEQNYYTYKI